MEPLSGPPASTAQEDREIEWQFAAADLVAVRRWLLAHPEIASFRIEPRPTLRLHDTYLDTTDWRVFRAGFALRLRERPGQAEATLKGLRSAREDLADRLEITEALPTGTTLAASQGPLARRVLTFTAGVALAPLFQVKTLRDRFSVRAPAHTVEAAEIALDDTVIEAPAGTDRLLRVEIEAKRDSLETLADLAATLKRACALTPAPSNKFAAGLRVAGLHPPGN